MGYGLMSMAGPKYLQFNCLGGPISESSSVVSVKLT